MAKPGVVFGDTGRIGMLRGFEQMARLLALTLGPIGGNIANARQPKGDPELLTDAATIARRMIQLPDRLEDAGAMMMRHLVWTVREEVGDGSATTAVLAYRMASEMQRMIAAGANGIILKRGMEKATQAAISALDDLSLPLEGEDRIAAVAAAAVGDEEIGRLLGEIYDVLGPSANVVIEPYIATFHDRAYHEGARFRGGYLSPYFVTDSARRVAVLNDAYVLVADMSFESTKSAQNLLEQVHRAGGKSVFVIPKLMSDRAIGVMVANSEGDVVKSCVSKLTAYGDERQGTVENIAILTGGVPLTDKTGMDPERIRLSDFGRADRVVATKDNFMIIGGHGDKTAVRDGLANLRQRLRETHDSEEREILRKLTAHFSAGVGELRIGALTQQDRDRLTEVAEQAIKAVNAGMESGVVPGGGAAYLNCIPRVEAVEAEGDEAIGVSIVARSLEEPMSRIAENAGLHPPLVVSEARRAGPGYGYDVRSGQVVDMIEAGIVDPTMVAKRALQQAASGAMMLLSTDALVLSRKPKESIEP